MNITFHKYHGNGNDFILIDNRHLKIRPDRKQISLWCHRHFGIGSDGLILIEDDAESDYEMVFFNPDGSQSFCGNGSRCSLHFCHSLKMIGEEAVFKTIDGMHRGSVSGFQTRLSINDVAEVTRYEDCYFVNTGSPHAVVFVENVDEIDVKSEGRTLRMDKRFGPGGCNVNFVEFTKDGIRSRVFERGVEDETFSSGSGTTAQAICAYVKQISIGQDIKVLTRGGDLFVKFNANEGGGFTDIWLSGSVTYVYSGEITL